MLNKFLSSVNRFPHAGYFVQPLENIFYSEKIWHITWGVGTLIQKLLFSKLSTVKGEVRGLVVLSKRQQNLKPLSCLLLQLQQDIQVQQNEVTREARKKERLEKEMKNLLAEMHDKQTEIKNLQQDIQRNKEEQLKMEQNLKEQKVGYMVHCMCQV